MLKDIHGSELHDRRPIGFDWQGADGSESEEESDTLESQAAERIMLVFGSIVVETAAPEAVSSHPSSIGAVGPELRVGVVAGVISLTLSDGRAKAYSS